MARLLSVFFAFLVFLTPCHALELIISDTGRNVSWHPNLGQGDNFSVVGHDEQPVGGVLANTNSLEQFLVPMPSKTELEQMSQGQEQIWVKNLTNLLKDRVHIATTNKANLVEIRLLQDDLPDPKAGIASQENPRLRRFARMTYTAIGGLVAHLQDRKTPTRITAAIADTGAAAFAQAFDSWLPYRDVFRRVDFVDAQVGQEDFVNVIKSVGSERVRIFNTASGTSNSASTFSSYDATKKLLSTHSRLTVYTLQPQLSEVKEIVDTTPWLTSLRTSQPYTVKRHRQVDGELLTQSLTRNLTGQDFRSPITGWDPSNLNFYSKDILLKLGVNISNESPFVVPLYLATINSNIRNEEVVGATTNRKFLDWHVTDLGINQKKGRPKLEQFGDFKHSGEVFPHISKNGQILMVMPADKNFNEMSDKEFQTYSKKFSTGLQNKVLDLMKKGQTKFVFQLVQDVTGLGEYANRDKQQAVARWGEVPTGALRDLSERVGQEGHKLNVSYHAGSNGTVLFSKNSDSVASFTDKVIFHDGRAKIPDVIKAIEKVGPEKFVIINTKGDHFAPSDSVANSRAVNTNIKSKYPQVTLLYLEPFERKPDEKVHIGSMFPDRKFRVKEFDGSKYKDLGILSGRDIRDMPITPLEKSLYREFYQSAPYRTNQFRNKDISFSEWIHKSSRQRLTKLTPGSQITIPSTTISPKQVSRFSGTSGKIILRDKTRLDLRQESYDKKVEISYDRLGIKSPKQEDVVIQSFSIGHLENDKLLGEVTRGFTPDPNDISMKTGFLENQRMRFDDLTDFNQLRQGDVGGVMLSDPATVDGNSQALHAGNVSVVFQNSAGVIDFSTLQRFVTALWGTYLSVEGPGVSIDPVSKSFKEHGDTHQIRYIGQVRNTELAKVMREADHLMKRWAIGTHRPDIKSFKSPEQFNREQKNLSISNQASRFWFVPQDLTFKRSDNLLLFSKGRMTVQTEYLEGNMTGEKNEANERFAQWFTENYVEVSKKYPIFQELFEYAKLVSLATYLREHRLPMLWFLMANRELMLTEESFDEVDQLVKQSKHQWFVKVYGGVEFELGDAVNDEGAYQDDAALQAADSSLAREATALDGNRSPVVFSASDASYTVASGNALKLFDSVAEGDTLQTDLALADTYEEKASKTDQWNLVAPRMELVRYYNPGLESRAQFGDGWHLLVPFHLKSVSSLANRDVVPETIVMVNLLSGIREELHVEEGAGGAVRYVPFEEGALTDHLVRTSDGSWILRDILGAEFVFDQEGDLQKMTLREDQEIKVKLSSKTYRKPIPGYVVEYRYEMRVINGSERKVLTSIKQHEHTARIDWQPDSHAPQIAGVRILKRGQVGPVEALRYEYNQEGRLAQVTAKNGRSVSVTYSDDHLRVLTVGK